MKFIHNKNIVFFILCSFLLVSCGPQKEEEKPSSEEKQVPAVLVPAPQAPEKKPEEGLTPQQEDELKIDEDNIMNPVPG